jgi:flagellin
MPLTINTNMAASRASYFLSKNNDALQKSLDRLSSGRKITQPADDAGGLAVSMKMKGSIDNLQGAANNISNALSFLQVQDGILDAAGQIVSRMAELQSLSTDVLKSTTDIDNYESEFNDLRGQLYDMTKSTFNDVHLFGDWKTTTAGVLQTTGAATNAADAADTTLDVAVSADGSTTVTINKSLLGVALLVGLTGTQAATAIGGADAAELANAEYDSDSTVAAGLIRFAGTTATDAALLEDTGNNDHFTAAAFTKALDNIASLRANNGGQASRLQYAQESVATQISNMEAALGRILDVDIAAETTNLAKQQILVQASASMVAQANSANQVALMLLQ